MESVLTLDMKFNSIQLNLNCILLMLQEKKTSENSSGAMMLPASKSKANPVHYRQLCFNTPKTEMQRRPYRELYAHKSACEVATNTTICSVCPFLRVGFQFFCFLYLIRMYL